MMILPPLSSEPASGPSLSFSLGVRHFIRYPPLPQIPFEKKRRLEPFIGGGIHAMRRRHKMAHRYSLSERLTAAYVAAFFAVTTIALLSCVSALVFAVGRLFV